MGSDVDYVSGEDYVVEFLGYRFGFNARDFQERVTAAAVRLGLIESNALDEEETEDLVELAADGRIVEARSGLGQYVVRHWERVALVDGESLVYWLRKLVFRGAWLDHRVKEGLLEVSWDEDSGDFGYAEPRGGRSLPELAADAAARRPHSPRRSLSDGVSPVSSATRSSAWIASMSPDEISRSSGVSTASASARLSAAASRALRSRVNHDQMLIRPSVSPGRAIMRLAACWP